jgi:hypothetical protein
MKRKRGVKSSEAAKSAGISEPGRIQFPEQYNQWKTIMDFHISSTHP